MGHPVGASGARIALHLALELGRRGGGLGAAGLCGGGGQGEALLLHVPLTLTPRHDRTLRERTAQHGRHDRPGRPGHRRYPRHRAGDQRTARRPRCRRSPRATRAARRPPRSSCADHPGASVHQGNIGSAEDCERVIQEVLDTHGRLDILVNNAGITLDKTVRKMTVAGLGPRHPGQPVRRLLPVPGDPAAHAGPRLRPHHQHQLDHRRGRQHRPGQLRRLQVRPVRPDHEPGAGDRPQGHHRQLRGTRLHLHRDGPGRPQGGPGQGHRQDPRRPPRRTRRDRPRRRVPRRPRLRRSSPARSTPSTAASTCSAAAGGVPTPPRPPSAWGSRGVASERTT